MSAFPDKALRPSDVHHRRDDPYSICRVDATPLLFMTASASASDSRRPTGFGASANDHAATPITAVSMASSRGSTLSNVSVMA